MLALCHSGVTKVGEVLDRKRCTDVFVVVVMTVFAALMVIKFLDVFLDTPTRSAMTALVLFTSTAVILYRHM
jgi:hypothetical protein